MHHSINAGQKLMVLLHHFKIIVPLKYMSNFWRSLEMPLTSYEVELSLSWIENCVFSVGEAVANAVAVANSGTATTFK